MYIRDGLSMYAYLERFVCIVQWHYYAYVFVHDYVHMYMRMAYLCMHICVSVYVCA